MALTSAVTGHGPGTLVNTRLADGSVLAYRTTDTTVMITRPDGSTEWWDEDVEPTSMTLQLADRAIRAERALAVWLDR
jgi:hypothetical protein